ncbi:MAG: outer membrane lipoprotein-sorting protein [Desulfocurvibacter africanus]
MKTALGILLMLLGLMVSTGLCSENKETPSVDMIIARSNHMALYQGADCLGTVAMAIKDKQGRVRKREFNMLRKNGDNQDKEQKYYVYFRSPADVRKMVFMVHKHVGEGKDDDRWMYLPNLDLVKRIAASDKRTSFVGSDFLYEDISGRSPEEDKHELLEITDKHFVLKNMPKKADAVEFAYYVAFIDKQSFMPVKMEYYKADNRSYRVVETVAIESIASMENGMPVTYPTVIRSIARDLDNDSQTEMVFSNVRYNLELGDDLFTERYLRRAPREVLQ